MENIKPKGDEVLRADCFCRRTESGFGSGTGKDCVCVVKENGDEKMRIGLNNEVNLFENKNVDPYNPEDFRVK